MKSTTVIVLGKMLIGKTIHPELKGRMDTGIDVFKKKSAKYLILSGGKSNPSIDVSEAEVMRDYALNSGIPSEKIILEEDSKDTIGNAYFTRKLIDKLDYSDIPEIYVVSSCYHMRRMEYIFGRCYGEKYSLSFDYCFSFDNKEAKKKEDRSIKLAEQFFKGIAPGDMDEIGRRLFSIHTLYKK